ncbi:hypothetical protein VB773_04890 [Haloarculaceae archaeon H-GB2-1]|nr:hypothetical protein [Haloarculaceae archaeon H-GB2-1]
MTEPRTQIENYRDRIRESDEITKDDADVLIEFSDQMDLLKSEYSDLRHRDLLGHCTRIAENVGGLADALEDHDAAEEIVRWINRTHENEWTNADYRAALRVFGGAQPTATSKTSPIVSNGCRRGQAIAMIPAQTRLIC